MAKYNCPNCGAPIGLQNTCMYCGTVITWTPSVNVYFTAKSYEKQVLQARAYIDLWHLEEMPEIEGRIQKELAYKIADNIPEVWDLKVDDDFIRQRRMYIAKLPVWKEIKDD